MPTFDLDQDRFGLSGPGERPGCLIVLGEVAVDRRLEVNERAPWCTDRCGWHGGAGWRRGAALPATPDARRHHIPEQRHRVTNWAEYDASLRQRGSLTIWFTEEAIAAWRAEPRTTRGGQPWYSPLAILTALTLRVLFRLALRQTEGLICPILRLLGLELAVPDHTTLSRRAVTLRVPRPRAGAGPLHLLVDSTGLRLCGPGEWLVEKHGAKARRSWRKLHMASMPGPAGSKPWS